tara:strand:+ start:499 stop:603 length:105 start_codon:yes stop_codon:yes gene_type:complete
MNWLFVRPAISKKYKQLTIEESLVRILLEKRNWK